MKISRKIIGIISLFIIIGGLIGIFVTPPQDELSIGGLVLIFSVGFAMVMGPALGFLFLIYLAFQKSTRPRIVAFLSLALVTMIAFVGFVEGFQPVMHLVIIICFVIHAYLVYWGFFKKQ